MRVSYAWVLIFDSEAGKAAERRDCTGEAGSSGQLNCCIGLGPQRSFKRQKYQPSWLVKFARRL